MAKITHVNDQNFVAEVLGSDTPVLVDFYADWCGPCRMLAPVINDLSEEYRGAIKVAKLDVDASPDKAAEYGVMSIPTVLLFTGGRVVEKLLGYQPKRAMKSRIDRALAAAA